ncbi:MAG TPA: copper amine oxidase N-terminal domain-containing protein [Desulfotomaculum sp.]|nr:MAG: hypothetical protein JL56_16740 [Desulfotomaculum sp. BICA1-6]HBX23594.1 copper amine oxidase N-terminal domain-containing protein [Desulfotomaculum sp.]
MILKGRVLLAALLTLVFCLTAVFPVAAVQPTAKDLVLVAIKNFDLGMNKGFYQKSQGEGTLEVTRFDGSLKEVTGDYSGSTIKYLVQMDDAQKAMKFSYDTAIKGMTHEGAIYLQDDKLILTKDVFLLLQDFGVDAFANSSVSLTEAPEYMYLANPQLEAIWEQMSSYQNGKLPAEYTEMLAFLVEAIPDECFSLSTSKVTMQLDQDNLVNTIVNLLTKMTNESEKVAEIMVNTNTYSYEQMGMDPEEMKREIAAGLASMTVPTREEIQAVTSLIEVNDFTFEYSLIPGGSKTLNVDLGFKAPDGSVEGALGIGVDVAGKSDNLEGSYRLAGQFNAANGPQVDVDYESQFSYTDTVADSDSNVNVNVKDNTTEKLMLDLGLVSDSVSEINTSLILDVPELTADNSADITELIPTTGTSVINVEQAAEPKNFNLVVNGVALETKSGFGKQGEIVVPARAVLEQLGYQVEWVQPNEIQVLSDEQTISLFIDQNSYTVNGAEKTLNEAPGLETGMTMIPLSFITAELNAAIDLAAPNLVITN